MISPVGLATGVDWLSSGRSLARYQRERIRDLLPDTALLVTACSSSFSAISDFGEFSVILFSLVVAVSYSKESFEPSFVFSMDFDHLVRAKERYNQNRFLSLTSISCSTTLA
ncbi:MAG: hypothetical protein CMI26_05345 [Opitutae bacterium]|nr:hypothetical protein [Opitutae bacterium]